MSRHAAKIADGRSLHGPVFNGIVEYVKANLGISVEDETAPYSQTRTVTIKLTFVEKTIAEAYLELDPGDPQQA